MECSGQDDHRASKPASPSDCYEAGLHLPQSRTNEAECRAHYIPEGTLISVLVRAVIVLVVFRINIQ
jgi:hypothetical protein